MKEIERKFLVDKSKIPFKLENAIIIHQFYTLGQEEKEERYRCEYDVDKGEETYIIVQKEGKGLVREEKISMIDRKKFKQKLLRENVTPITKKRYSFETRNKSADLDIYIYPSLLNDVLEIEFYSIEEARKYDPPPWIIKEVTEAPYYKNKNIWKRINGK